MSAEDLKLRAVRCFLLLGICAVAGVVLLFGVYLLPTEPMKRNAADALSIMQQEGPMHRLIPDIEASRIDNYTDSVMLNTAIYGENGNALMESMAAKRYSYQGETAFGGLVKYLSGETGCEAESYARYWHGYLIFLKPLLLVFNYGEIRLLISMLQLIVLAGVLMEMAKRDLQGYVKAFLAGVIFLIPVTLQLSLQYSQIYFVTMFCVSFLLKKHEKLSLCGWMFEFYFFVGILSCFFDFLTYPLVALGFVLLVHFILEREHSETWSRFMHIGEYSVAWGLGYVGIWCVKWILATLLLRENILRDAILQVLYRSSVESSDSGVTEIITRKDALLANFHLLVQSKVFIAVICIWALYIACKMLRSRFVMRNKKPNLLFFGGGVHRYRPAAVCMDSFNG